MILDLDRFVNREQPQWRELEALLGRMEADPGLRLDLAEARRFHYLYLKTGADLAKVQSQSAAPQVRAYLESLVSRAYAEIHENRNLDRKRLTFRRARDFALWTFPDTFRRHVGAFWLALAITLAGVLAGTLLLQFDVGAKRVILPFDHLHGSPAERVAAEESGADRRADQPKGNFAAYLMTHNIRVSVLTLVLGFAWGAGPLLLLFYNGVILGAVSFDYVADGQWVFLLGWLLPHGVIEIPAILLAGQAGLILGAAMLKGATGGRSAIRNLRDAAPDVAVIIGGVAAMLVWAGIIEAFFSQYHSPVLPYGLKIGFGCAELAALVLYLSFAGRRPQA